MQTLGRVTLAPTQPPVERVAPRRLDLAARLPMSPRLAVALCITTLALVAVLDHLSGIEISFSLFYLVIPGLLLLHRRSSRA